MIPREVRERECARTSVKRAFDAVVLGSEEFFPLISIALILWEYTDWCISVTQA